MSVISPRSAAAIRAALTDDVREGRIPGAVAMLAHDGETVFSCIAGHADREAGRAMRRDTLFRIYSMTKPVTSAALLMLCDEGRLALDDAVEEYLPQLADRQVLVEELGPDECGLDALVAMNEGRLRVRAPGTEFHMEPARRPMTVRDLLRHTAGFGYGFYAAPRVDRAYRAARLLHGRLTPEEVVTALEPLPLKHHPGECWDYSVATDVAARLIEVVSGVGIDRFLRDRVFAPLGMNDTSFGVADGDRERFAQLYTPRRGGGVVPHDPAESRRYFCQPPRPSGGVGLVSTAPDYLRFCSMLLGGGELDGVRLLLPETVAAMTRDQLVDVPRGRGSFGYSFGLGVGVGVDPSRMRVPTSVGEYHWGGIAGTRFWVDPVERIAGVYMVQILPHTRLGYGEAFKARVYRALREPS